MYSCTHTHSHSGRSAVSKLPIPKASQALCHTRGPPSSVHCQTRRTTTKQRRNSSRRSRQLHKVSSYITPLCKLPLCTYAAIRPYSVGDKSFVFNAENWFVAQEFVVNAIDDDVILESPYGSLLRVLALDNMVDVNITLLISEGDSGEIVFKPFNLYSM